MVFSDVVMPGEMDGVALARFVRAQFPNIALVPATGYSNTLVDGFPMSGVELLLKPYRADQLDAAMRAALAAAGQQQNAA